LDEAKDTRAELLEELTTGKVGRSKHRANATTWTLKQALDKTLSIPKPDGWRGCAYEKQATLNAQSALDWFGPNRSLDAISLDEVDKWLADCEAKGNSDSTINRKRSALSKIAGVAHKYGHLEVPLKLPRQRKEPVGRIRQISKDEEQHLLQCLLSLYGQPMCDFVTILIDTGMRRGELLNLRPTDVNHTTGVLMVYGTEGKGTKNGKIRSIPMTSRVRLILSDDYKRGLTCFSFKESEIRHAWDRVKGLMGLAEDDQFTLHVCRHTCASRLVQGGVSLAVVKEWLGHSNIQTTMRYAHLYPQDLMRAVAALEMAG
jgi:integrase